MIFDKFVSNYSIVHLNNAIVNQIVLIYNVNICGTIFIAIIAKFVSNYSIEHFNNAIVNQIVLIYNVNVNICAIIGQILL